jgi:phosphatidylserine decarboxylase
MGTTIFMRACVGTTLLPSTYNAMTVRMQLCESLSFLLTNRIPRRWLTLFMGWLSSIEHPLVSATGIWLWQRFADLKLEEARKQRFSSLQDCFTRELQAGARPIHPDPAVVVSPCDAIVGACGRVDQATVLQAKGFPYSLVDLLGDTGLVRQYERGMYATLRITSSMYHRFHAPHDLRVEQVNYISGDTWNVYPIALRRIERLFCKNERAVLQCRLAGDDRPITLVPIAAILVASIRLHCLDVLLHLRYRGANVIPCDARFSKGEEMGWFQHGSTIVVFAPPGAALCETVQDNQRIRVGEPLFRLSPTQSASAP